MSPNSLRHFAGASISADDLFERYKIACDLKQIVDRAKITDALQRWAKAIDLGGVTIIFVSTGKEIEEAAKAAWDARAAWAAKDARAARAAWAARDAWAAKDARAAWAAKDARAARDAWAAKDARDARAAWAAWAAKDARDGSWELSWNATIAIGAASEGEEQTLKKWLPMFEAFEAGAFALWIGAETIYVAVIPSVVKVDEERRLHCEDGPAFAWLDDIREYYWRGVNVPAEWITDPASIKAETALAEPSLERRRAACALIPGGWQTILNKLDAETIDRDRDPQIGELVQVQLPGDGSEKITARYLRVRCGTGRQFAVCVPPTTKTALDAQAWMLGLPKAEFMRPEVRT